MKHIRKETRLEIVQDDITRRRVDAVVNAANAALCGGGGVDGAIHRAGGPSIMAECRRIKGGCPTGEAVITTAGNLPASRVIHTVGPVYKGGACGEAELLASAYRNSLKVAAANGMRTIAFPSISTGAYRFPLKSAAKICWETILEYVDQHPKAFDEIWMVAFSDKDKRAYEEALTRLV